MKRRIKCDACSLPLRAGWGTHVTDERICRNTDGPGFFLCDRPACREICDKAEAAGGLERLRALYADGRRKNERKRGRPRNGKSAATKLIAFRVTAAQYEALAMVARSRGCGVNALAKSLAQAEAAF